jgi:hypothetical protein
MKKRTAAGAVAVAAITGALLFVWAGPASAHEERTLGRWHVAVGFGEEPAYAGQENSVQMFLHDARDRPVTDLSDTLKVEVIFGSEKMPAMTMQPDFEVGEFGTPGDYRAFFFPTRPGDYSFHFTGTIKGQAVDATFTSGPTTFSSVIDPGTVEFPAKDPTTGELAQRLDREVPRLALATEAQAARHQADSARLFGIIGIAVGAVGLVVGATALAVARRRP